MRKLEIGAGNSRLGPEWETSDVRPDVADYCVTAWDIDKYFGEEQFDILYACMVLEHIPRFMQQETLNSWYRALKYGGVLEIIVPDMEYIATLILGGNAIEGIRLAYGDQGYKEDTHVWGFTLGTLKQALEQANFKIQELKKTNNTLYAKVLK